MRQRERRGGHRDRERNVRDGREKGSDGDVKSEYQGIGRR